MKTTKAAALPLLFAPLLAAVLPAQTVTWTATLDQALARAKAETKVVMATLNADGERASDQLFTAHLHDPKIAQLSGLTINLFGSTSDHGKATCRRCKSGTCGEHRNNDFNVRRKFFDGDDSVVTPQHVFVSPDGKVISSASGQITVGELEWMWVQAIRSQGQQFAWELSGRMRAPRSYKLGKVDSTKQLPLPPAPSKKAVTEAIKALKKAATTGRGRGGRGRGGRGLGRGNSDGDKALEVLIRSDDRRAVKAAGQHIEAMRFGKTRWITRIGHSSPLAWSKTVASWLGLADESRRQAVILALEQFADPKSLGALRKYHKSEKAGDLEGRFLRAMAAVAPTNSSVIALVRRTLGKHTTEVIRAHATIAAGTLEDRAAVTELLQTALQDASSMVRTVAAYVIATRLDQVLAEPLAASLRAERDAETKSWMSEAVKALQTGDPAAFDEFLAQTLDKSPQPRGRNRGGAGAGPGSGGEGSGGENPRRGRRGRGN